MYKIAVGKPNNAGMPKYSGRDPDLSSVPR